MRGPVPVGTRGALHGHVTAIAHRFFSPVQIHPVEFVVVPSQIKPGLEVVGSDGVVVGTVHYMYGHDAIKLRNDEHGVAHYLPVDWVQFVDQRAHLRQAVAWVRRAWLDVAPHIARG